MFQSLALSVSLSPPHCLSLCHSISTCQPLSPPAVFPISDLSVFLRSCTIQPPIILPLFLPLSLVAPWSISVKECGSSRSPLSFSSGGSLPNREVGLQMWQESQEAHMHTFFFFLPDASRAHIHSQAGLMKLLRQILGRNSICREDERCDKEEREERRMKGQEEEKTRVVASGLMVHHDPALSTLLFTSEFL